jgi:hypothetical protein
MALELHAGNLQKIFRNTLCLLLLTMDEHLCAGNLEGNLMETRGGLHFPSE